MGCLEKSRLDFQPIFRHKNVFLTGHTGFKGSWLALWLAKLGAHVTGYALAPPTVPNNFETSDVASHIGSHIIGDTRDSEKLRQAVKSAAPDVVFHLAAQPIVRKSYRQPRETFEANVMGTVNLLEAVRTLDRPCAVVVITSDKCYENRGQVWGFRECDPLGGYDPYSASKAASEIVAASYRNSFFPISTLDQHGIQLATTRAGNVIGGGDWAEDRIVVDIQRAVHLGEPIELRSPHATRPWQHVLVPLSGYCQLAAAMLGDSSPRWSSAWNFGPFPGKEKSVLDLTRSFISYWGSGQWVDGSDPNQPHEDSMLGLSIDKAMTVLDWAPCWDFEQTVAATARWYKEYYCRQQQEMADHCLADITAYEEKLFKTLEANSDPDRSRAADRAA